MKVTECKDKKIWNEYLFGQKQAEFLQSWEWGEFQKEVGNKVLRLQIKENEQIVGQVQGFEYKLAPFVKFIYIPKYQVSSIRYNVSDWFGFLKKQGYIFARIEPLREIKELKNYKIVSTQNRQPQNTFVLNVGLNEEELLQKMHSKTRYNIGLAQRKGVSVKQEKNIDVFWRLNKETIVRDKFKSHDRGYYEKMLEMENCYQLTAYFEGEGFASIILIHFGNSLTYLHGVSGNKYRNLMAPYLLQWEGIKKAKSLGVSQYDFGGVAPSGGKKQITTFHTYSWEAAHKWTGITRFKVGFGGEFKTYPRAVEVVLNPFLYKLFKLIKLMF